MSDREQNGLRGPVKSCTEENTFGGFTDSEGKTYPPSRVEYTTEYDLNGRVIANRTTNSDGSKWIVSHDYDPSGRLLKISWGTEGQATTQTTYSYDQQGRLERISDPDRPNSPVTFRYDERGRKTKTEISRPADYRPEVGATAGSPFEVADRAPNLAGGGTATTTYDEHDRPAEVEVRDAEGNLVNRAVRTYDAQGHVLEEKQILDHPETMFPPETLAKIQEQSGMSPAQLRQELGAQIKELMAGQPGPFSVSYTYDRNGRANRMSRRIFNEQQEIETSYNEHGDVASEITRTMQTSEGDDQKPRAGLPEYSEVRYSYKYDQHENWIEKAISSRFSSDGAFQSANVTRRTLTYY
jgi:YD repeat-containing protein